MARQKSDALVLSSLNYSESSRIIHVLCRDEGRLSLMAKGVRKAKGPGNAVLQPFNVVSITYYLKDEASFGTLSSVDLLHTWPGLHSDLLAYAVASYWFEILEMASQPRLEAAGLYDQTVAFLTVLSDTKASAAARLRPFFPLFRLLGFELSMPVCVQCGRYAVSAFNDHSGQFYCARCSDGLRLNQPSSAVLGAVRAVAETDQRVPQIDAVSDANPYLALLLFNRFITRHLDHPLRSFQFVERLLPKVVQG